MLDHLQDFQIVLGSNSPRRKEILGSLGIDFIVRSPIGDEIYPNALPALEVATYLAIQKANAFSDFSRNELYITADTVVIIDHSVLGKPSNEREAIEMLTSLSGKTHHVVTGFCLRSDKKTISQSVTTEVEFAILHSEQIAYYVRHFNALDKAGAYGIQEWIGMIGVSKIEGSYFNVVGLPTHELFTALMAFR